MSTHNLCFEQKYKKYQRFLPEKFRFLEVKFSIYLNRCVFVMLADDIFLFLIIASDKVVKSFDIFLICPQKPTLWYSLEVSH